MQVCKMVRVGGDSAWKPFSPSTTANRKSSTPVLELVHDLQLELGAIASLDPLGRDVLVALAMERQS